MRELDEAVCQHVMRWRRPTGFYPSARMGDAWLVVREMHNAKTTLRFSMQEEPRGYRVWFGAFNAYASEAPVAVCLAALKALGIAFVPSSDYAGAEEESRDIEAMRALYDGSGD
jgi:hypothetical protein